MTFLNVGMVWTKSYLIQPIPSVILVNFKLIYSTLRNKFLNDSRVIFDFFKIIFRSIFTNKDHIYQNPRIFTRKIISTHFRFIK